jgi:hypothetical protein
MLRYQPEPGRLMRTLTEVRTTVTLVGFPAVPDGAAFEVQERVSATTRVRAHEATGAVVVVTVDSVSGQTRMGADPWVDVTDAPLTGQAAEAIVSPRFGVAGIRSSGPADANILQLLGAGVIGLGFAFPDTPLRPGESFETGGRIRARVTTDASTGLVVDEVVFGDLALLLDSVTVVGGDTLSFFQFRGALAPRSSAAEGGRGDVVTSTSGAYAGRVVWSARWSAFVSGATRLRVDGRITAPGVSAPMQATWDRTVIHSVRP